MSKRGQLEFDLQPKTWGGARKGAGRKKSGTRKDPLHRVRPDLARRHPVHVVMRVQKGIQRLRQSRLYGVIRRVLNKFLGNDAFRICHLSIQHNHLHYLIEAINKRALSTGMQRLNIAVAKALNKELRRKGKLFAFRYHATQIRTPRQARNALAYVLNNWRRHREDQQCELEKVALIDRYSSAVSFDGWVGGRFVVPAKHDLLPVAPPKTWLLRMGWSKHGPIAWNEVPGSLH